MRFWTEHELQAARCSDEDHDRERSERWARGYGCLGFRVICLGNCRLGIDGLRCGFGAVRMDWWSGMDWLWLCDRSSGEVIIGGIAGYGFCGREWVMG
ncbi:hypothetical protein M0R45_000197 [Rubus argutus]|uniref:Uncharacterized protein n=1 Tax=Rubus argutus TaxID=59490 RepID=A0AAW1VSX0_RUBAR